MHSIEVIAVHLGATPSLLGEKDSTGMTRLGDRMVAKKKGGGMLEWLAANWTTIVGTLIGIAVGAYFGLKGWRHKKLIYVVGGSNIFSGLEHTVPDVEVKFSGYGQPIKALTVTKIGFWNAGNETIKKQDVVKDDPIRIHGKEGIVFLSASVAESISPLNKIDCKLNQDRSLVNIAFEYLDRNQGANIQIFHTGTSVDDLTLRGTIMGAPPIRKKLQGISSNSPAPTWLALSVLVFLWLLWGMFMLPGPRPPNPDKTEKLVKAFDLNPDRTEKFVNALDQVFKLMVWVFGILLLGLTTAFVIFRWLAYVPKPFSKALRL